MGAPRGPLGVLDFLEFPRIAPRNHSGWLLGWWHISVVVFDGRALHTCCCMTWYCELKGWGEGGVTERSITHYRQQLPAHTHTTYQHVQRTMQPPAHPSPSPPHTHPSPHPLPHTSTSPHLTHTPPSTSHPTSILHMREVVCGGAVLNKKNEEYVHLSCLKSRSFFIEK